MEDHIRKLKEDREQNSDEESEGDNEDDWAGWEVASDSSDSSSESEGWIDVSSDSENELELSDSEDEKDEAKSKEKMIVDGDEGNEEDKPEESTPATVDPAQSIAATKVCTMCLFRSARCKLTIHFYP